MNVRFWTSEDSISLGGTFFMSFMAFAIKWHNGDDDQVMWGVIALVIGIYFLFNFYSFVLKIDAKTIQLKSGVLGKKISFELSKIEEVEPYSSNGEMIGVQIKMKNQQAQDIVLRKNAEESYTIIRGMVSQSN